MKESFFEKVAYYFPKQVTGFIKKILKKTIEICKVVIIGGLYEEIANDKEKPFPLRLAYNKVSVTNMGILGKLSGDQNIIRISPTLVTQEERKKILHACDIQSSSRIPFQGFSHLTGGPHFFTSSHGTFHRHFFRDFAAYINNAQLCFETVTSIVNQVMEKEKENKKIDTSIVANTIVRKVFLKVFFNTNEILDDLEKTMYFFNNTGFGYAFSLMGGLDYIFGNTFRNSKNQYQQFAQKFMRSQLKNVMEILKDYPYNKQKNYLADVIIRMILEKPGYTNEDLKSIDEKSILELFSHPYVQAIPSIFIAGNNAINLMSRILDDLLKNFLTKKDLFFELDEEKFPSNALDLLNPNIFPKLHQYYHAMLKEVFKSSKIPRITKKAITISEQISIPENSKLFIYLWEQPFSVGSRSCPAPKFTEVMVKAMTIQFISNVLGPESQQYSFSGCNHSA